MKTINLYFDFEFTSLSPDAQPISLGIVSDDLPQRFGKDENGNWDKKLSTSKSFYAEFSDFDINRCDDWVKLNVISKLRFILSNYHAESVMLCSINADDIPKSPDFCMQSEDGLTQCLGNIEKIKKYLTEWLSQFSDYNIQFICDCGTFDWYWMVQLLDERPKLISSNQFGLPKLPDNISPVPFDLNDLIAIKEGITPKEAFNIERLGSYCCDSVELYYNVPQPHNSLFDAKVIKESYFKLK